MNVWFAFAVGLFAQERPASTLKLPPRIMPVKPGALLKLLPDTPKEWKVTTSVATNQFTDWLITVGIRNIECMPPPQPAGPGQPAEAPKLMKTSFRLIDSGYEPTCLGQFEKFKPGQEGPVTRLTIKGCPSILFTSETRETLDMLINERFILHVEVENQGKDGAKRWAEQVPMDRFAAIPSSGERTLPVGVPIATVDELNPHINRETKQFIRKGSSEGEGDPAP